VFVQVSGASRRPVVKIQDQTLEGVQQYKKIGEVADQLDQGVVGHEVGIGIKSFSPIRFQQLKIAGKVDHQE